MPMERFIKYELGTVVSKESFQVYSINDMRYAKGQQRNRTLGHCCRIYLIEIIFVIHMY